jgi:hypothetical protein
MLKRTCATAALVAALFALSANAGAREAPSHPFGLGLVLGEPTGLTAKLYLSAPFALQLGLGWIDTFNDEDGLYVNVDFIWHPAVLTRQPAFTMPFYIGVGGRLYQHHWGDYYVDHVWYSEHDTRFGARVPFGILMDFTQVPLDIYLELAVVIDLVTFDEPPAPYYDRRGRVGLDGGIGVRYYF